MLLTTILLFAAWAWLNIKIKNVYPLTNSWISKENQTGPVIGDLGGIPVSIPHEFAHFVEYEGDPHFMEPRNGPTPKRTFQSKLRSFGYEVRYPDMKGETKETWSEKHQSLPFNTKWISVGIRYFGGEPGIDKVDTSQGLQRGIDFYVKHKWDLPHSAGDPATTWREKIGYQLAPEPKYGLSVYEIYGYDDAKRDKVGGNGGGDENIYYHVNQQGKVDTSIRCDNQRHDFAQCEHHFYLNQAKYVAIDIRCRIGFLPQWQEIQAAVTQQILGFVVKSQITQ